uniref:FPL domain-containing protein n=1 Tax=Elaeophora elaphi TaxID=1147741 RepID=A0A0R3RPE1_9BILA
MLRRLGLSSLLKPKNPHSLEYLKYLHEILRKNEQVTENNRKLLVECLRAVAEILIWGDQNESSVFDFFLERQMLEYFLSIMKQNCGSFICVQLLQTLNILFENIRHKTSLYYLLSNNHVNSIITYRFNFENEEIMAYYISFLKTLSFKLNMYTIHFFFNEANQDFPLYTEVIKFQNHSEAMVRIAVRTTTLNIYKVEDEAMRSFVRAHSRVYFCALSDSIARQSIEIDHFARSAENEYSNRKRLDAMIDDYLDYMHYLSDILLIKDEKLSAVLIEVVFERLLGSLYLSSLGGIRFHPATAVLTPVSTLFFLTHFLLIVDDSQAVQTLLSSFFFGDGSDVEYQWIRSEKATWVLTNMKIKDIEPRAFFNGYMNALVCSRNDHSAFYGLIFIYALCQNKGARGEILEAVQFTSDVVSPSDHNFLNGLLDIIDRCAEAGAFIRTITVELCCIVLRQLLLVMDASIDAQVECERRTEKVIASLVSMLTPSVYSEELFLEMFEDEFYNFERNRIQIRSVSTDSSLLLPPPSTPLNGVLLNKRLPCGNEERTRKNIQLFFHLRRFALDLRDEEETHLPISSKTDVLVEVNDCINLENSDLLACTVVMNEKNEKVQRFLVTDQAQLILVEPDNKRMGWAVVRFAGLLQDTQLTGDLGDSRALHIIVSDASNRSEANNAVYFNAKFLFDDRIRCMAAKQRLTKGRQIARQCKLDQICDLLGIARKACLLRSNKNPFRIVKGCLPGSLRRQPQVSSPRSSRSSSGSLNIVPDDPEHGTGPSTSKDWKIEDM